MGLVVGSQCVGAGDKYAGWGSTAGADIEVAVAAARDHCFAFDFGSTHLQWMEDIHLLAVGLVNFLAWLRTILRKRSKIEKTLSESVQKTAGKSARSSFEIFQVAEQHQRYWRKQHLFDGTRRGHGCWDVCFDPAEPHTPPFQQLKTVS